MSDDGPDNGENGAEEPLQQVQMNVSGLDPDDVVRCSELLRTVDVQILDGAGPELWKWPSPDDDAQQDIPPPDPKAKGKADPAAAPPQEEKPPFEAADDPQGAALLLSHSWEEPFGWPNQFGAQTFQAAKQIQVTEAVHSALRRDLGRPRVWVDCASLPDPICPSDHPREQKIFGPFKTNVGHLKALFPLVDRDDGYTILQLPDGAEWEGEMKIRTRDESGRPHQDPTLVPVKWEILPGWYFVSSGRVIAENTISPEQAATKPEFRPRVQQFRRWLTKLSLRDEIWVEFTLGSIRGEVLELCETMWCMHGGLVAIAPWNYFDRLWPLCEWAIYCARRGVDHVQLGVDALTGPALVEYHRALRRVSVFKAGVRDIRDRDMLLDMLEKRFRVTSAHDKTYEPCHPPHVIAGKLHVTSPEIMRVRVVDWSPVERFVRASAIAVFARESALAASCAKGVADEAGWTALAEEFGYIELRDALKLCKPYDWLAAAKRQAQSDTEVELEMLYARTVEAWWAQIMLPVMDFECRLCVRDP
eukprot:gnl/TRDRNA2_/TRDRNA2_159722_c1_seq1.p1 gnl/TRDRNA2_/TRDRNA2_159722_c1~~gnl/TRDRNA2_/TRDRNA2_159722_c1_seq1.p1  ORF type:complete len:564 (-),score=81.91 gnl/TRDRNA2_/TRDRNA2_159722_c1_seq1:127-1722(-)